jgi:hypothetical protein
LISPEVLLDVARDVVGGRVKRVNFFDQPGLIVGGRRKLGLEHQLLGRTLLDVGQVDLTLSRNRLYLVPHLLL